MHELDNILNEITFILLHFFVFLFNYFITGKNIFNPPALYSLLWTGILLLHFILGFTILDQLDPIGLETFLLMFAGVLFFSLGSFVVANFYKQDNTHAFTLLPQPDIKISITLRLIFLGIVLLVLPFHIKASFRVFLASNVENFLGGLRSELSYGEEDIGPTKYLTSFSFVVFAINYYLFLKEGSMMNKVLLAVSSLATISYAILATGRTLFFAMLAVYLGISYFHKKNFSLKNYVFPLFIFMAVFIFFGMLYGKGGDVNDSAKDNIQVTSETTALYLVSSINALDYEVKNKVKSNYPGENSLRFFIKIGQGLNLASEKKVGTLLSDYAFIPYPVNVYTVYSPYMRDFGKLYAWLMIALFGAIHSMVFYNTQRIKNLRNTLYYSFLLFPLLMSFFQDQYMSLFSFWIQIIFFIELFLFLNKLFISWKQTSVQIS